MKWDYEYQTTNFQIAFIWVGKTINYLVFTLINFQLATGQRFLFPVAEYDETGGEEKYQCPED